MKQILLVLVFFSVSSLAHAQALYLAHYEGDGTEANPFRAHGGVLGTVCSSLRPNPRLQSGYGLCKGESLPARSGVIDLSGKRSITKADRDAIGADRSLTITATTFDGLISELVDKQNVSLGRKDGRQSIVINGEEIWSRPAPLSSYIPDVLHSLNVAFHLPVLVPTYIISVSTAWAVASVTETFTCADDTDGTYVCDHTWTRYTGTAATGIVSNTLRMVNAAATNLLYNSTDLDSTDMSHLIKVATLTRVSATNVEAGPGVRHTGTGTSTYAFCVLRDAVSPIARIGNVLAGSATEDGTVGITITANDTLETRALGDQLSCKHNGVTILGPLTDNTGSGNVNVMVRFSGSGAADSLAVVDDSAAQVITASQFGPLRRRGL